MKANKKPLLLRAIVRHFARCNLKKQEDCKVAASTRNSKRSKFLKFIFFAFFSSLPLYANSFFPLPHDGKLRLYNYHLNETLEIQYEKDEKLIPEALEQINIFLRSRDSGIHTEIDPNILKLADHLQDHFKIDSIEIISAFRTKEFNDSLKNTGHKVSPVSFHTKGQALDIHIDEIREETLRDYLLSLKQGGVGYYGPLDFVHIDTGPPRSWSEEFKNNERKLIGVLQPKGEWQLTSDKNDYLAKEKISFSWNKPPPLDTIFLQHFWRGKWEDEKKLTNLQLQAHELKTGKHRILFTLKKDSNTYSSNEFYVKKE